MEFVTIPIDQKSPFLAKVFSLYESSFPEEERRSFSQLQKCFSKSNYRLEAFFQSDIFVGFVEYWLFDTFVFIEHISVSEENRGKTIGKSIMKKILWMNYPVFLEIELLTNDVSIRRFNFYKSLNFKKTDIQYFQPSYATGKKSLEMLLLACHCEVDVDVKECVEKIHAVVYQKDNA